MSFASFVTYLFFPTAPPWWQYQGAGDGHVYKVINDTISKWGVAYFVSPFYSNLNPNKFAAFPSLHAAFPALAAIYSWNRYRLLAIGLVAYSALVWLAIVYLGEHYFVDALAGLAFALCATLAVTIFVRVRRARPAS
jgi:membrane-associated phospholipid phosphatase